MTKAPKTRAFLAAITEMPNVSWAAKAAGIRREAHYRRLKCDPAYKEAFEAAWELGCDALEERAIVRAMEGVQEPVFYQGEEVGYVTRYYHTEFLLRGAKPEKYRERHEHSGPNGGPLQSEITIKFVAPDGSALPSQAPVPV